MPPAPRKTLRRLFTESARKVLASGEGPASIDSLQIPVAEFIQPVVLVGRGITSDTQSLDEIVDTGSRVKVSGVEQWGGKDTAVDASSSSPDISGSMAIGDSVEVFASTTGADAEITLTPSGQVYMMEYVVAHCEMAAVAATRTLVIGLRAGLTQRGWASARNEYVSATLTQTTGEFGSISWLPNGVEAVNDNGTFTRTVGASPLPLPFYNEAAFFLALDGTTLNAGDTLGISMIIRRIA